MSMSWTSRVFHTVTGDREPVVFIFQFFFHCCFVDALTLLSFSVAGACGCRVVTGMAGFSRGGICNGRKVHETSVVAY